MPSRTNERVTEICKPIIAFVEEEILPTCDVYLIHDEGEGYGRIAICFSEKKDSTELFDVEKYKGRNLDISLTLKNATIERYTDSDGTWYYQLNLKLWFRCRENVISTYLAGYYHADCDTLY